MHPSLSRWLGLGSKVHLAYTLRWTFYSGKGLLLCGYATEERRFWILVHWKVDLHHQKSLLALHIHWTILKELSVNFWMMCLVISHFLAIQKTYQHMQEMCVLLNLTDQLQSSRMATQVEVSWSLVQTSAMKLAHYIVYIMLWVEVQQHHSLARRDEI